MRTTPLFGTKAWFGPRRFGWGLAPVSYEGWIVNIIASAAMIIIRRKGNSYTTQSRKIAWVAMIMLSTAAIVVIKGTAPGGHRARLAFDAMRKTQNTV
ncbi:MAG: hypothetical protein M1483_01145 [Actinobacteria bacterium]|nr:hypothetical protein [Actinomycetota bacterium]MCL6104241.1 hypothetical protein [Actinomycetota bacterium]